MATSPTVGFISLGCPKALVDSEQIITRLRAEGYGFAPDYHGADLVVVNTCGFIDAARAESLHAIGEALEEHGKVIVTGCLGANAADITEAHPRVLAVTGPHACDSVMRAVRRHLPPRHDLSHDSGNNPFTELVPPQGVKLTPPHYAYLKIAEGCNHRCSFCIIPSMRGGLVSRPAGEVLNEAARLIAAGAREILVVSQDTAAYGVDLKYRADIWAGAGGPQAIKTRLTELAGALGDLADDSDTWIRLHYVYPYPHVDELIPLMAEGKILPYLDIPFQHAAPAVLKNMRRPAAGEAALRRIEQWRKDCPQITLRSTFIVGFPGETEAEFRQLLEFLREARLDRVGCFQYSPVKGAAANALPGALDDAVKQERHDRLMRLSRRISAQKLRQKIGRRMTVLVDGEDAQGRLRARSAGDAPEIDGVVYLDTARQAARPAVGAFVRVRITGADEYDLYAVPA